MENRSKKRERRIGIVLSENKPESGKLMIINILCWIE